MFDAYGAVDRVASDGRICDSGMKRDALATFPDPPDIALGSMDGMNSHDFDDGVGQDAWLLIRAEATGSHYIKIDSQGGFAWLLHGCRRRSWNLDARRRRTRDLSSTLRVGPPVVDCG